MLIKIDAAKCSVRPNRDHSMTCVGHDGVVMTNGDGTSKAMRKADLLLGAALRLCQREAAVSGALDDRIADARDLLPIDARPRAGGTGAAFKMSGETAAGELVAVAGELVQQARDPSALHPAASTPDRLQRPSGQSNLHHCASASMASPISTRRSEPASAFAPAACRNANPDPEPDCWADSSSRCAPMTRSRSRVRLCPCSPSEPAGW